MHYEVDLADIKEYRREFKKPDFTKTALLVIEMQEVFRSQMKLISTKQIANVKQLINAATQKNGKVIHVRHNDSSDNSAHMISWWGGDKIEKGSADWEIIDELKPLAQTVIDKNQYSAFYATPLDDMLKQNGITDVIICGVMTNCCCETTARDAFMRGFNVYFVNDATATINQELHLSALKNLAFGFAYIVNTTDLL